MRRIKYLTRGSWAAKRATSRRRSAASARSKATRVSTVSLKRKALINVQALPPMERGKEIHFRVAVIGETDGSNRTTGVPLWGDTGSSTYKHLMSQIAQGSGVEQRAGRVIKLRRLTFNYTISAGTMGYGANARVVVVFDKRPERSQTLEWVDVFTSTATAGSLINAMVRENRDGSFEVLYDKTTFVEGARPHNLKGYYVLPNPGNPVEHPEAPANGDPTITDKLNYNVQWKGKNAVSHKEVIDLSAKRFYTQYTYNTTDGVESTHEYGAVHVFAWSDIDQGDTITAVNYNSAVPYMNMMYELEFVDY